MHRCSFRQLPVFGTIRKYPPSLTRGRRSGARMAE